MKTAATMMIGSAIAAAGLLLSAPSAQAGCQGLDTPWGGGQRCDSPIDSNGFFQRCDSGGAFGFAIPPQCYQVDAGNLGNNQPWIGP